MNMETETPQKMTSNQRSAVRLMVAASVHGLDWAIDWQDGAFVLLGDGAKKIEPGQVIGETESDARDCILLAAASLPKKRGKKS